MTIKLGQSSHKSRTVSWFEPMSSFFIHHFLCFFLDGSQKMTEIGPRFSSSLIRYTVKVFLLEYLVLNSILFNLIPGNFSALIGKSWKTHPEIFPGFHFSGV